ncbi:MAG: VWA domain-containing protein [Candidatus Hydrogenedentes bacterium]|nr:VWA domain-containing protein [Candidatus Hydrogenedentota bacterium]
MPFRKIMLSVFLPVAGVLFAGCPPPGNPQPQPIPAVPLIGLSSAFHDFGQEENVWTFEVWNAGAPGTTLDFSLFPSPNWITVEPAAGSSTGPEDRELVTVSVNRHALTKATFSGVIRVTASNVSAKTVTLSVTDNTGIEHIDIGRFSPAHRAPSHVQYLFSLVDQNDQPIVIPETELGARLGVDIRENGQPIDPVESAAIVHTIQNVELEVALVLDFSQSMAAAGTGIDTMIDGVELLANGLAETHRMAAVEFHDRTPETGFTVLQEFTSNKGAVVQAVDDFAQSGVVSGFSTVWDAANLALDLFPAVVDPSRLGILVFLTDGVDNSSITTPEDLAAKAQARKVRLFPIGVGEVPLARALVLDDLAKATGGLYLAAQELGDLLDQFDQIRREVDGTYLLSYVTPKQTGEVAVEIEMAVQETAVESIISDSFDASAIFGNDLHGVLGFSEGSIIEGQGRVFIRADHIPRNISKLRFHLSSPSLDAVALVAPDEGGLLAGWTPPALTKQGFWETTGPALAFGDFGPLFRIELSGIQGDALQMICQQDNSIYTGGLRFFGGDESEILETGDWRTYVAVPASTASALRSVLTLTPAHDAEEQTGEVVAATDGAPRFVTALRFKVDVESAYAIELGEILAGWSAPEMDADGFWLTTGPELAAGTAGNLVTLRFEGIAEPPLPLTFTFDSGVLGNGAVLHGGNLHEVDLDGLWTADLEIGTAAPPDEEPGDGSDL